MAKYTLDLYYPEYGKKFRTLLTVDAASFGEALSQGKRAKPNAIIEKIGDNDSVAIRHILKNFL